MEERSGQVLVANLCMREVDGWHTWAMAAANRDLAVLTNLATRLGQPHVFDALSRLGYVERHPTGVVAT